MTQRRSAIMQMPVLALLAIAPQAHAIEVTNVRSGLACNNSLSPDGSKGWICQVTEDVLITDQGECHFSGEVRRCTWVGVEFDYHNAHPGDELACTISQTKVAGFGNHTGEIAQDVSEQAYKLKLKEAEGTFYNPQYFVYSVLPSDANRVDVVNECKHQGVRLFQYRFQLRFPSEKPPKPVPKNKNSIRDLASVH